MEEKTIEKALWQDYEDACERIKKMNGTEEKYKDELEERDRLRNELIKLKQLDQEKALKKEDNDIQCSRDKKDNVKDWIHIGLSVAGLVISSGLSIWGIKKTFKFDETSTVTSTLGRGFLNGVMPKSRK